MRRAPSLRSPVLGSAFGLLALAATPAAAVAQDTLDVGVLKQSDQAVVQKLLYPKEGAFELGAAVGWMPFDTYTTTPVAALRGVLHFTEELGAELEVSGGYSLKNHAYRLLETPAYGIQPDAYRFLGGAMADLQWSPVYAKLNWMGRNVIHHDIYGLAGLGGALEQAMMPDGTTTFSPGGGVGVGMRFFLGDGNVIRVQLRDDLLAQKRAKTDDWFLKQNVSLTVGFSKLKAK
ncbi:MAG: outer membrane beta-barrel domain-containing protein [Myxococcota bacterium]|nr:outer membrane beta-barrel domain-containing protein [Myxococcota bacterium]MEC8423932.1 outer membrane beta-barrel domain-containing protein [Myxococcota bacterium]